MQADLWKLYIKPRTFEFSKAYPKIKILHMHKNLNGIVFL